MTKGRWGRAEVTGNVIMHGRWGRAEVTGTGGALVKGNWGRAEVTGTRVVAVADFEEDGTTVEALTAVPLTAVLADGTAPDSATFTQRAGPTATITTAGVTGTVVTPGYMDGSGVPQATTITVGVTATAGGQTSSEVLVDLLIPPALNWVRQHPTTTWTAVAAS